MSNPMADTAVHTTLCERSVNREETDSLVRFALASAGLFHELGNHLNLVVLQAAVLQTKVPEPLKESAGAICTEGVKAAGTLQPVRQRNWPQHPLDVNAVLAEALGSVVTFAGGDDVPPLLGMEAALHWFARFLQRTLAEAARGPQAWATDRGPSGECVIVATAPGRATADALADPLDDERGLLSTCEHVDLVAARYWLRSAQATLTATAANGEIEVRVVCAV